MATYYNSNGGGGGGSDWGSWVPIIVLFCIPTPVTWLIALFWLVSKLRGNGGKARGGVKRHPYDIQRERRQAYPYDSGDGAAWEQVSWEETEKQSAGQGAGASAEKNAGGKTATVNGASYTKSASAKGGKKSAYTYNGGKKGKKSGKKSAAGKQRSKAEGSSGLIIGGAIMSAIFGLGTVSMLGEFLYDLQWGYFFSEDLVGVIATFLFFCGGLAMLFTGLGGKRRAERYANYLAYIGANREVSLAHMSATFDVPVRKLCKDLRRMLSKGILPTGYLDLAEGKLFLTEMGYRAPEEKKAPAPEQARQKAEDSEDAILREIRQVNDEIPDEEMSAKIFRIEEITGKILAYQKSHPNRESQLRTFLNYYLPTTLKILRAYAQLDAQGIEGENISAAKARIEGMMDQVVAGFEKQLDKLFQDDALDIASDVEVLESMLKKDGLSDGQGITLGL